MKNTFKLLSFILAITLVLSFVACSSPKPEPETSPASSEVSEESQSSQEPEVTEPEQAAGQITITDQTGETVTLEVVPEKLVSGYYITTTTMMALDLTDKLVGIEAKADKRPLYAMAAPQLLELPNVGSAKEFDVEGCIALEPDLLIAPAKIKDSAETISSLGIPVILVSPESHEELIDMINIIGTATGTTEQAQKLVDYYNSELADVTTTISSIADDSKPVVYMGANSSYLSTAPKDMYQASIIEMAGGKNAGAELEGNSWAEVSYEQILLMNPDVIVIPSYAEYTKNDIMNDAELAEVTAVKSGAVYTMPGFIESWDSPGPGGTLGLRWMMYALHEDLYTKEQLDAKVAEFYETFYKLENIDLTQVTK